MLRIIEWINQHEKAHLAQAYNTNENRISNTYRTFVVDTGPTVYEEFSNLLEPSSTGCS